MLFRSGTNPSEYKYDTKHLCIKEVYYPHFVYNEILNISDKIIVLYRENYQQQLESFLNSITTNNWDNQYIYNEVTKSANATVGDDFRSKRRNT